MLADDDDDTDPLALAATVTVLLVVIAELVLRVCEIVADEQVVGVRDRATELDPVREPLREPD